MLFDRQETLSRVLESTTAFVRFRYKAFLKLHFIIRNGVPLHFTIRNTVPYNKPLTNRACSGRTGDYYMANPVLGKSLRSDWFFLGQDFAVRTVSMETVQPVYFCFGAKPANSKFATKQRKKNVNIVILHSETTRRS